jgi:hypothetical protein
MSSVARLEAGQAGSKAEPDTASLPLDAKRLVRRAAGQFYSDGGELY